MADHKAESAVIHVTAEDRAAGDSNTIAITNDYCLVATGSAEVTNVQVHAKSDGTAIHVIYVKGVRRG